MDNYSEALDQKDERRTKMFCPKLLVWIKWLNCKRKRTLVVFDRQFWWKWLDCQRKGKPVAFARNSFGCLTWWGHRHSVGWPGSILSRRHFHSQAFLKMNSVNQFNDPALLLQMVIALKSTDLTEILIFLFTPSFIQRKFASHQNIWWTKNRSGFLERIFWVTGLRS